MRLLLAMSKHETNTFSPVPTNLARFRDWSLHEGAEVIRVYRNTNHPLAAFLDLAEAAGAEVVTPIAAEAMPSGVVEREAYEYITGRILAALKEGKFDGVMLDLHGAMVAETEWDADGALLEAVHKVAPGIPICVTCDMHGNITSRMVQHCLVFNGYKSYPHVDMYQSGKATGSVFLDALAGKCKPVVSFSSLPLLAQTLRMGTADEPMKTLQDMTREDEKTPGLLISTVFGGFPLSDIPSAGMSVVVVANGDRALADAARDRLLRAAWALRAEFVYQAEPLEQAVARAKAMTVHPIILLDHADNVGSGGTSDSMFVIKEVMRQGLKDVAMAAVWDPVAVREMMKAGIGAEITLDLGGKIEMPSIGIKPQPLRLTGRVRRLSDGEWVVRGPMYTGLKVSTGPTALFETQGVSIVVTSLHHEPWDAGIFTSMGIDPTYCRYLLLKSRIHYRAGFAAFEKARVTLDGVGVTTSDNSVLSFNRIYRPIYPLDKNTNWP